jgi:hypothetical protein
MKAICPFCKRVLLVEHPDFNASYRCPYCKCLLGKIRPFGTRQATNVETCQNCKRHIVKTETACVFQGNIVCIQCDDTLRKEQYVSRKVPGQQEVHTTPERLYTQSDLKRREAELTADWIAIQLRQDIDQLLSLGIKMDKGAMVAQVGSMGAAGYAAFTGNWAAALVMLAISLFSSEITDEQKQVKLQECRQKWFRLLSNYNSEQLQLIQIVLNHKHPAVFAQCHVLLPERL